MRVNGWSFCTAIVFALLLSACGDKGRIAELEEQLEAAPFATEQVQSDAEVVRSANNELESAVDRLDTDNWRDVVPDIRDTASAVDTAQTELESSSSELESAVTE